MIHWRRGTVSSVTGGWGPVVTVDVELDEGGVMAALADTPL